MSNVEPFRSGEDIMAPKRAEDSGDPGLTGVGWVRLTPGDPDYRMWDDYLKAVEADQGAAGRAPGRQVGG